MANRDELHHVGEVFVGSPQVAHAAGDLHFDQPRKADDGESFDLLDVQIANRLRHRDLRSFPSFLTSEQKPDGDAVLRAELCFFSVPVESGLGQDASDGFAIPGSNDQIEIRGVPLVPM
jgi:hypothetical protein